jgi:hypothetical protein
MRSVDFVDFVDFERGLRSFLCRLHCKPYVDDDRMKVHKVYKVYSLSSTGRAA